MSLAEPVAIHQQKVKKPRKIKEMALSRLEAGAVGAIAGMLVSSLLLYVFTVNQEVRLNADQMEIRKVRETNVRLRAELSRRQSPDIVEGRALMELGMAKPAEVVFAPQASIAPPIPVRPPSLSAVGVAEGY
ncbi:MAG TPA: septum formation initiator family protein [Chroococcales cyanobacterium]|jgi:cell division protein FtsB